MSLLVHMHFDCAWVIHWSRLSVIHGFLLTFRAYSMHLGLSHSGLFLSAQILTQSLKALLKQPSTAMVPQDFSRVDSTQVNRVLASLEIAECVGNVLDPIVVNSLAPAAQPFDFSEYANENAGTLDLLEHHQAELIKFGVKFRRGAFTMYDLPEHKNPYPIVHDGQEYHGGLDGGIAPHGLSKPSAANQLRVAYEHKQSNDQKQRYREQHGDMTQVLPHVLHKLACLQYSACNAIWV